MTYFNTVDEIRDEAGFLSNPAITDANIEKYLKQAHGEVLGIVGGVYNVSNLDTSNPDFDGSLAHDYLARAEALIAAGYLIWKEYGLQGLNKDSDGNEKVREGRTMLQMLYNDPPQRLFDNDGVEFTRVKSSTGMPILTATSDPIFSVEDDEI